jgi:hypothetical protein
MRGAEILIDPPFISRAARWMRALEKANPKAKTSSFYLGKNRLLVLYGIGKPARGKAARQHLKAGGRVAMWDLGYWNRDASMRLSIDRNHPTAEQLASCDGRPPRARPDLARYESFDPAGPILLCGMGPKSHIHLRLPGHSWERQKAEELAIQHPGRTIIYRPKPGNGARPINGTKLISTGSIEDALRGCSLVVCRHSNVAIDACIAGVPVECEDGAAFALYDGNPSPSEAQRHLFLDRLAWWNWGEHEATEAWRFMEEMTAA